MLENITQKLGSVFDKLKGRGALSEKDVDSALGDVRKALLEADVAIEAVKTFLENTRKRAVGTEVLRSITPGQMVIKVVHDELVTLLGNDEDANLNIDHSPPVTILLAGLQGSGKTTTAGKLALWIKTKKNKKVLLASLDTYRPAAREQLRILGEQAEVAVLPEVEGDTPASITKRATAAAKIQGIDVLILDTAGRQSIDTVLMSELKEITSISKPSEILLVADAMTGQDAVVTAKAFKEAVNISGLVLSRADGDARGGAAISMRHITQCPIKFLGVGEKIENLEVFHPDRIANRILGMGDVVTLVEKASEEIDEQEAKQMQQKFLKGRFTLLDYSKQLDQLTKMGGIQSVLKYLPGLSGLKEKMEEKMENNDVFKKQKAIINSMTPRERIHPELVKASRKIRISKGSGTNVQDINKLLKQFKKMSQMMKKMGKNKNMDSVMNSGQFGDIQSLINKNKPIQ